MSIEEHNVQIAIHQIPKKGNYLCGDSYFYTETDDEFVCAIADGLGSGKYAKESSDAVIEIIRDNIYASVEQLVKKCNEKLWGKRGVVLGILKLHYKLGTYSFSSIGNIGMMTVSKEGKKKRNIPNAGYLAGYKRTIKVIRENLEREMNFYMFSDGVKDADLSHRLFLNQNIYEVINQYAQLHDEKRDDDTTLIGLCYQGNE
ncbi:MAG TPA: indirect negative regulator of sigma-B activity [Virgibacillus sp.]|nr:indirect negative regulator of sigma-B activity [Virgibacillus sp.]